jgi:hypothetical protein
VILGSGDPTPFDGYATFALGLLAALLLAGSVLGSRWESTPASVLRWGALGIAVLVLGAVLILTPTTSGAVGAGRLLTVFPAALAVAVFFLIWSWRLGHF